MMPTSLESSESDEEAPARAPDHGRTKRKDTPTARRRMAPAGSAGGEGGPVSTTDIEVGPIDYLVVEWPPGNKPTGDALPLLVDLVERGIIRILDFVFVQKDEDGSVVRVEVDELGSDPELTVFEGASSGLLGEDDYKEAGNALGRGCAAALLVYENTWAAPFATAVRRGGARLVSTGRIPLNAIIAALDELDDPDELDGKE
jgi:hypothetical protein